MAWAGWRGALWLRLVEDGRKAKAKLGGEELRWRVGKLEIRMAKWHRKRRLQQQLLCGKGKLAVTDPGRVRALPCCAVLSSVRYGQV